MGCIIILGWFGFTRTSSGRASTNQYISIKRHKGSLRDLMIMKMMWINQCYGLRCHQILTRVNTCGKFWTDVSLRHHHQNTNEEIFFGRMIHKYFHLHLLKEMGWELEGVLKLFWCCLEAKYLIPHTLYWVLFVTLLYRVVMHSYKCYTSSFNMSVILFWLQNPPVAKSLTSFVLFLTHPLLTSLTSLPVLVSSLLIGSRVPLLLNWIHLLTLYKVCTHSFHSHMWRQLRWVNFVLLLSRMCIFLSLSFSVTLFYLVRTNQSMCLNHSFS